MDKERRGKSSDPGGYHCRLHRSVSVVETGPTDRAWASALVYLTGAQMSFHPAVRLQHATGTSHPPVPGAPESLGSYKAAET